MPLLIPEGKSVESVVVCINKKKFLAIVPTGNKGEIAKLFSEIGTICLTPPDSGENHCGNVSDVLEYFCDFFKNNPICSIEQGAIEFFDNSCYSQSGYCELKGEQEIVKCIFRLVWKNSNGDWKILCAKFF